LCAALVLICLLGAGCGGHHAGPPPESPAVRLEYARSLLERGSYYDAITELTAFTAENPGSGLLDTALFYLGEAYLGRREYAMAAAEFERLLREFPGSGHAPAARYSLGVAYDEQSLSAELDPTMTERAIEQFGIFLRLHPENEHVPEARERLEGLRAKMAKKTYLNGRLYVKLKQPEAARFYFDIVVAEYPESPWAPKALYEGARAFEMEGNSTAAIGRYKELIRIHPLSEEAGQAKERLAALGAAGRDIAGEDSGGASDDERP